MITRTAQQWTTVLNACGVRLVTALKWAPAFAAECIDGAFSAGESETDDFMGQLLHECSRLERVEEGLFYKTPGLLMKIWPSRFPTRESELPYLRSPEKLANFVYAGRMGNVNAGDGFRFKGRGPIQLTGRSNYLQMGQAIGADLVGRPELMLEPVVGLRAAIRWWERTLPDALMGDLVAVTKRVNGGTIGLDDRREITLRARAALGLA